MADVTINQLTSAPSIVSSLLLPVTDGTSTYKLSVANVNGLAPVQSVASKTGIVTLTNADVGLGNVENKSSATIRGEITSSNVTTALGYTPLNGMPAGSILQVLQAVYGDEADVSTQNKDWTDVPNLTVNITPRSTNSKIHLRSIIHQVFSATTTCNFRFMRNSTVVGVGSSGAGANGTTPVDVASFRGATSNNAWCNPSVGEFIDSPNTISQITYKVMFKPWYSDARTMRWNNSFGTDGDRFRVISTLTVSEIAG
jgi:hypothetical protein